MNCLIHLASIIIASLLVNDASCKKPKYCKFESCSRIQNPSSMYEGEFGLDGLIIELDKGLCQTNYNITEDCVLPPPDEKCSRVCQPRAVEKITIFSRTRQPQVETIIKSCYAPQHNCRKEGCYRKPNYVFLFTGSKYQKRVDVGKCVGNCGDEEHPEIQCVPTRTRSVAVEGPNGVSTLEVVEDCSCENTLCYRADHFESYSVLQADKNSTKDNDLLVNVGKCIGSCPGVYTDQYCYPTYEDCQVNFPAEYPASCVPTRTLKETFIDPDHKERQVFFIEECGCHSG